MSDSFVQIGERKTLTAEIEIVDDSSATQLQYSTEAGNSFAVSYMQAVTPNITLGGAHLTSDVVLLCQLH
jgi:hypothetical protein